MAATHQACKDAVWPRPPRLLPDKAGGKAASRWGLTRPRVSMEALTVPAAQVVGRVELIILHILGRLRGAPWNTCRTHDFSAARQEVSRLTLYRTQTRREGTSVGVQALQGKAQKPVPSDVLSHASKC